MKGDTSCGPMASAHACAHMCECVVTMQTNTSCLPGKCAPVPLLYPPSQTTSLLPLSLGLVPPLFCSSFLSPAPGLLTGHTPALEITQAPHAACGGFRGKRDSSQFLNTLSIQKLPFHPSSWQKQPVGLMQK